MKNFTKIFIAASFLFAMMLGAFTAMAQTDERQDYMQQMTPQESQIITPISPSPEKNVSQSEHKSFSPSILVPPAGKKVKAKKGFFKKLLNKLNPLNWFGKKKAQLSTGVLLMLAGLALLIVAIVLTAALTFESLLLATLLWTVGGILITVGLILWIVELVAG